MLEDSPDLRISLVGHVPDGTADADELSLARAWAVAGYLEWRGIPFERMEVSGAGSELALDDLDPDDPKNARIELRVIEGA